MRVRVGLNMLGYGFGVMQFFLARVLRCFCLCWTRAVMTRCMVDALNIIAFWMRFSALVITVWMDFVCCDRIGLYFSAMIGHVTARCL